MFGASKTYPRIEQLERENARLLQANTDLQQAVHDSDEARTHLRNVVHELGERLWEIRRVVAQTERDAHADRLEVDRLHNLIDRLETRNEELRLLLQGRDKDLDGIHERVERLADWLLHGLPLDMGIDDEEDAAAQVAADLESLGFELSADGIWRTVEPIPPKPVSEPSLLIGAGHRIGSL